jgi:phosphoglycolate phosphatase
MAGPRGRVPWNSGAYQAWIMLLGSRPLKLIWQIMAEARRELIFDLDGTLIDSAPDLARALNQLLTELGRPPLDLPAVRRLVGDGAPELVRRALVASGATVGPSAMPELFERYRAFYLATAIASTRAYPGVPETLATLQAGGYRMVVCTNKFQVPTLKILDFLHLTHFFGGVAGGDVVPARKPDPRHLLAALALVNGSPDRAVMIGDGVNDVAAAKAAGIPVLLLDSGYGEIAAGELGGDGLLSAFSDIPGAVDRLG